MKRLVFIVAVILSGIFCFAQQNEQVRKLVLEGIALHDKGDYDGAIRKYNEALEIDKNDFDANYEKSFSCMYAKKYDECIEICKMMLDKFADHPSLKHVFCNYGNTLDDIGKAEEAISIYEKGISKFSDFYLLHFNKGLTLMRLKKYDEALMSYQEALKNSGLHPSSNLYTGMILEKQNRIPALLAYSTFIVAEPNTERTRSAFEKISNILYANVKKEGNNTTITISPDLLSSSKNKKTENDFSMVELTFSLVAAMDNAKGIDSIASTPADKLSFKLQMLINSLKESIKSAKGFYWEHYVPFFVEMKAKNYVGTLSQIMYASSGDEQSLKWLEEHKEEIDTFNGWLRGYKW